MEALPENCKFYQQANEQVFSIIQNVIDGHNSKEGELSPEDFLKFSRKRIDLAIKLKMPEADNFIDEYIGNSGFDPKIKNLGMNIESILKLVDELKLVKEENQALKKQLEENKQKGSWQDRVSSSEQKSRMSKD